MVWQRALRFGITGVLNTAVHVVTASAWIHTVHPNPALANGVAFSVATLFSYGVNTWWTFATTFKRQTLIRFFAVALIGLPLSAGIAGAVDWLGYGYAYGIAAVVCTMPPVNFLLHHFWTYRHEGNSPQPAQEH
ncbi:GtrA family protein [uncultured Rhodoferax sp.]|uniref:GtrA family protein n=1 Tax=uncultured Rhodoferax sp. TaxID=223188 RepID=UPI0025F35F15|nr:GtrA family protein [uncultured Rhodoferax sp.]